MWEILAYSVWLFQIVSETSFPIEAGLASSAAGFAAIAYGLGQIYHLDINDIIRAARMGRCGALFHNFFLPYIF